MRNSFFSSVSGRKSWQTLLIASLGTLVPGNLALAEEASVPKETNQHAQDGEVPTAAKPTARAVNSNPEIADFYEKYGAYCDAIVDDARELRYALKLRELEAAAEELKKQIEVAEAQNAALEKWVSQRQEFAKQATAKIVEIYANMRPEASAARLQQLDMNLAASILLAIPPRQASPILNEMDEKNAAAITSVMAASARVEDPS